MKKMLTVCGVSLLFSAAVFAQNFGIDQPNPTQKLDINGNIKIDDNISVEGNSSYRVYRNLCTYSLSSSAAPGAFVITTNQPWNSACMFRVKIEGYFYDATAPFELTVGGYIYTTNTFYNYGYVNNGSKKLTVRLARNNSTNTVAILLGDEASTYSYPKLSVVSFMQGHGGISEAYADGWTITQETSLAGYSYITNVPEEIKQAATGLLNSYFAMTPDANQYIASINPVPVNGLSITLTPASASSKFLIMAVVNGSMNYVCSTLLYKNGNKILSQAANSNEPGSNATTYGPGSASSMLQHTINYMDAPGTTAPVTYDIRLTSGWSGTTYGTYVNDRSSNDMRTPSTLTILEFAQ